MSAQAVPFWGQMLPSCEACTSTTAEVVREKEPPESLLQEPRQVVLVVAANLASLHGGPHQLRYRVSGLPPMSQVLLMEAPLTFNRFASAETLTLNEVELSAWRGVMPVRTARRILFTETLELPVGKLRRLVPRVSLGRSPSDDDDA